MRFDEIMRMYRVKRDVAELVEEYLKERDRADEQFILFDVAAIQTARLNYKRSYGKELTVDTAKQTFELLPSQLREHYGDKFLLGLLEILSLDE